MVCNNCHCPCSCSLFCVRMPQKKPTPSPPPLFYTVTDHNCFFLLSFTNFIATFPQIRLINAVPFIEIDSLWVQKINKLLLFHGVKNGEELRGVELGENVGFLLMSSWQMWPHVGGGPWACAHHAHWLILPWFPVSCSISYGAFCEPTKQTYTITCEWSSSVQGLSSSLPTFYFLRACLDAYYYYWIWSLQSVTSPPPPHCFAYF